MKTSISHLPQSKQQELRWLTQLIVETVAPEKVILYGSHATGNWVEDRYTEGHITYEYLSDYDILVITKAGEKKKDYEITDQVKNRLRFRVPVNVITHDIDYVNKKLSEGQYFFTDILKEGILLYDSGNSIFSEPRELTPEEIRIIAQKDFDKWFSSAKGFLRSSFFNLNEKEYKISVFELHQAAERTYNTVTLVFTGYKPKTHNLDKLRHYTRKFSEDLFAIFPLNTKEEEHLFELLQKGYIDARYNDEYIITEAELSTLIARVNELQTVTQEICEKKIESFK